MATTYNVAIDWTGDQDFADAGEDVSARVLDRGTTLTIRYGRDQARAFSPLAPGRAQFELDNRSRDYSPENTSSPLYGLVLPGRAVRIQADSTPAVVIPAGVAAGTGSAYGAIISTSSAANAPADVAAGTATAYGATVSTAAFVNAPAGAATGTGTAYNATTDTLTGSYSDTVSDTY